MVNETYGVSADRVGLVNKGLSVPIFVKEVLWVGSGGVSNLFRRTVEDLPSCGEDVVSLLKISVGEGPEA